MKSGAARPEARQASAERQINEAVLGALMRLDPRLAIVYQNYRRDFGGDVSAARLARHLVGKAYRWVPTRRQMATWLAEIKRVESNLLHEPDSGLVT